MEPNPVPNQAFKTLINLKNEQGKLQEEINNIKTQTSGSSLPIGTIINTTANSFNEQWAIFNVAQWVPDKIYPEFTATFRDNWPNNIYPIVNNDLYRLSFIGKPIKSLNKISYLNGDSSLNSSATIKDFIIYGGGYYLNGTYITTIRVQDNSSEYYWGYMLFPSDAEEPKYWIVSTPTYKLQEEYNNIPLKFSDYQNSMYTYVRASNSSTLYEFRFYNQECSYRTLYLSGSDNDQDCWYSNVCIDDNGDVTITGSGSTGIQIINTTITQSYYTSNLFGSSSSRYGNTVKKIKNKNLLVTFENDSRYSNNVFSCVNPATGQSIYSDNWYSVKNDLIRQGFINVGDYFYILVQSLNDDETYLITYRIASNGSQVIRENTINLPYDKDSEYALFYDDKKNQLRCLQWRRSSTIKECSWIIMDISNKIPGPQQISKFEPTYIEEFSLAVIHNKYGVLLDNSSNRINGSVYNAGVPLTPDLDLGKGYNRFIKVKE